jgi:eukaryotic-like serine/threonine-protein kinase
MSAAAEHKYRVIKRLEAGGMAEVYLGEAVSVQGFKKKVAIKRVLPHLAQNESFIEMFLDEARLSARLNHTNIVTVFDISKREDTYFLIMEFVDGVNLKRILESVNKRGVRMRLADAIHICIEACRGLGYAHDLSDENHKPLGIVHRDISPPNIMVTRRGEVKLADFGLAKASNQFTATDPGIVKGKFSYLSPEAAFGKEVDARSDIFSLGIVLWEMLAGKRLFWGENDYATVKLVQKANIPRLAPLNRDIDETFEEVLLKALTRDPADRYQTAREFGEALSQYIFQHRLLVTSYDLASLVQSVANDEPGSQANEQSLIDRLIQDELDESVAINSQSGAALAPQSNPPSGLAPGESYEDPESWFSNDRDVIGELHKAAARAAAPERRPSSPGSWRESGKPAEPPPLPPPRPPPPPAMGPSRDMRETREVDALLGAAAPDPRSSVAAPSPVPGKHRPTKYIIYALLVVACGAAAWAGTHFM